MPYFEGDVFSDEPARSAAEQVSAPIQPAEPAKKHSFETDLEDIQRGADLVLKHAELLDEPPQGTFKSYNYGRFPLSQQALDSIALSSLGYPLYFVDRAVTPLGELDPTGFATYLPTNRQLRATIPATFSAKCWDIVNVSTNHSSEKGTELHPSQYEESLYIFLGAVCAPHSSLREFEPASYRHGAALSNHSAAAFRMIEAVEPNVLKQGHMTKILLHDAALYKSYGHGLQTHLDRYQQLLDEGVSPLGYEELLGLSMRHIRFHLNTDPNFPKAPRRVRRDRS